jgi:hypothetical protein
MAAKKIVLIEVSKTSIVEILEFYIEQNGNANYSKKLSKKINSAIKLIAKYNYTGKRTNLDGISVFIQDRNAIFYEINDLNSQSSQLKRISLLAQKNI